MSRPAATPFPQWRRLRGYAFDPGLSQQFETAAMNEITFRVPWEKLDVGPVGEYVEVVDYDPASRSFYDPVNLEDRTSAPTASIPTRAIRSSTSSSSTPSR